MTQLFNPGIGKLQPYPFEKLKHLLNQVMPPEHLKPILLSIGEPKHPSPKTVLETFANNLDKLSVYPATKGMLELREAIANWASVRFKLKKGSLDPETNILPVNGTREALFSFTQTIVNRTKAPLIVSPNPFYQIYEGAAYLAGAELILLPCMEQNGFIPDYDKVEPEIWRRCQILFVCSPGNPSGSVTSLATLRQLIQLADKYDFIIASDECYSEVYCNEDEQPVGLLQACADLGRNEYQRCLVFHSLSKRSNLPGLRSGFVAGDAEILKQYLKYRTYHGCAMPLQNQLASISAWNDEQHVIANRQTYRSKFKAVLDILEPCLELKPSDASFYLWPRTPICDQLFSQGLYQQQNVTVLPGSYLSRTIDGINPGENRVRMALVAPEADCIEAAKRIATFVKSI